MGGCGLFRIQIRPRSLIVNVLPFANPPPTLTGVRGWFVLNGIPHGRITCMCFCFFLFGRGPQEPTASFHLRGPRMFE